MITAVEGQRGSDEWVYPGGPRTHCKTRTQNKRPVGKQTHFLILCGECTKNDFLWSHRRIFVLFLLSYKRICFSSCLTKGFLFPFCLTRVFFFRWGGGVAGTVFTASSLPRPAGRSPFSTCIYIYIPFLHPPNSVPMLDVTTPNSGPRLTGQSMQNDKKPLLQVRPTYGRPLHRPRV